METTERGRILGIGGIFFKSVQAAQLRDWYRDKLGMESGPEGHMFSWRAFDNPEAEHFTIWSVFPGNSKYFDPSSAPFMVNYIVDDLDALLAKLTANGVTIDPKREDHEYGRFAWIYDADGNKLELWEPPNSLESSSRKNDSASG